MKEIKAYELTDGTIVLDEKGAVEQQRRIDLQKRLREFWKEYSTYNRVEFNVLIEACMTKEFAEVMGTN